MHISTSNTRFSSFLLNGHVVDHLFDAFDVAGELGYQIFFSRIIDLTGQGHNPLFRLYPSPKYAS